MSVIYEEWNEFGDLDETIQVDETFEELEQSILELISESSFKLEKSSFNDEPSNIHEKHEKLFGSDIVAIEKHEEEQYDVTLVNEKVKWTLPINASIQSPSRKRKRTATIEKPKLQVSCDDLLSDIDQKENYGTVSTAGTRVKTINKLVKKAALKNIVNKTEKVYKLSNTTSTVYVPNQKNQVYVNEQESSILADTKESKRVVQRLFSVKKTENELMTNAPTNIDVSSMCKFSPMYSSSIEMQEKWPKYVNSCNTVAATALVPMGGNDLMPLETDPNLHLSPQKSVSHLVTCCASPTKVSTSDLIQRFLKDTDKNMKHDLVNMAAGACEVSPICKTPPRVLKVPNDTQTPLSPILDKTVLPLFCSTPCNSKRGKLDHNRNGRISSNSATQSAIEVVTIDSEIETSTNVNDTADDLVMMNISTISGSTEDLVQNIHKEHNTSNLLVNNVVISSLGGIMPICDGISHKDKGTELTFQNKTYNDKPKVHTGDEGATKSDVYKQSCDNIASKEPCKKGEKTDLAVIDMSISIEMDVTISNEIAVKSSVNTGFHEEIQNNQKASTVDFSDAPSQKLWEDRSEKDSDTARKIIEATSIKLDMKGNQYVVEDSAISLFATGHVDTTAETKENLDSPGTLAKRNTQQNINSEILLNSSLHEVSFENWLREDAIKLESDKISGPQKIIKTETKEHSNKIGESKDKIKDGPCSIPSREQKHYSTETGTQHVKATKKQALECHSTKIKDEIVQVSSDKQNAKHSHISDNQKTNSSNKTKDNTVQKADKMAVKPAEERMVVEKSRTVKPERSISSMVIRDLIKASSSSQGSTSGRALVKDVTVVPTNAKEKGEIRVPPAVPREPFRSSNPEENNDIDHPDWDIMKKLETDEERYKRVRMLWKSKKIPKPNRDLTFHSFRKRRVLAKMEKTGTQMSNTKGHKRSATETVSGNPKRMRTKTQPCTYLIDSKITSAIHQCAEDKEKALDKYYMQREILNHAHRKEEITRLEKVRRDHCLQNYPLYDSYAYAMDTTSMHMLKQQHEMEMKSLYYGHEDCMRHVQARHNGKLKQLEAIRAEIQQFFNFYKGLNKCDEEEIDPTVVTEIQMEELEQIQNVYDLFDRYYQ